jgi:hypothetical protein
VAESPSGSRSPLRTAGIALLGVGIIAATAGLFTSVTSGDGTSTAVPSASSQALPPTGATVAPATPAPAPPSAVAPPPATAPAPASAVPGAVAQPSPPPVVTPAPVAPAPQQGAPAGPAAAAGGRTGGSAGAGIVRVPLRVYNNSLIQGLAAQAKSDFEAKGWTVTNISGYSGGNIAQSTVYYRPGTAEESAAQELGREFGLRVEPRFPGIEQSTGGVIVIVTEDYKSTGRS